jgi:hypothetical protein
MVQCKDAISLLAVNSVVWLFVTYEFLLTGAGA